MDVIFALGAVFNLHKFTDEMKTEIGNPGSLFYKTMVQPSGYNVNRRESIEADFAGANGITNARGLAAIYNAFLTSDSRIIKPEGRDLKILKEPAVQPALGNVDRIFKTAFNYHLGFQKPSPVSDYGSPSAYGFAGVSGSFAYADPETGVAYAYVTNKMDFYSVDPRDIELRKTINQIIPPPAMKQREHICCCFMRNLIQQLSHQNRSGSYPILLRH